MTEISFHFNAPDKVAHACRVLRKALNTGSKVVVAGEPQDLSLLDAALWTFSPLDFLPHCLSDAASALLAASPIVLGASLNPGLHTQVLLNLGATVADGFERYERVIEVVGIDDADRLGARARWKHYASRGYAITRHDLAPQAAR